MAGSSLSYTLFLVLLMHVSVCVYTTNITINTTVTNTQEQPLTLPEVDAIEDLSIGGLVVEELPNESVVVEDKPNAGVVVEEDQQDPPQEGLTYEELYEEGIKFYLDNMWHECSAFMERAVLEYKTHARKLAWCRRECKREALESPPLAPNLDADQTFYEAAVKNALCLLKCRSEKFGKKKNFVAPLTIDKDFQIRKPYDYLQLCYFKIGRYQDAADAAVTVLAAQPHHDIMASNLRQYIDDYSADTDILTNLEFGQYAIEYVSGDRALADEDFELAAQHMERALVLYWEALADCRAMCEEPYDMGWFPDFVSSVANHFTFTFRCKRRCAAKLGNLYGNEIPDFLASIFNYLQYSYHKLNNVTAACEAVESYLELVPTDATMIRNKQFYLTEYQKSGRHFVARKEIIQHAARERYEEKLLNFIDTEFVFLKELDATKELEADVTKQTQTHAKSLTELVSSILEAQLPQASSLTKAEL